MNMISRMGVDRAPVGEPERRGDERSEAPRSGGSPTGDIVRAKCKTLTALWSRATTWEGTPGGRVLDYLFEPTGLPRKRPIQAPEVPSSCVSLKNEEPSEWPDIPPVPASHRVNTALGR